MKTSELSNRFLLTALPEATSVKPPASERRKSFLTKASALASSPPSLAGAIGPLPQSKLKNASVSASLSASLIT